MRGVGVYAEFDFMSAGSLWVLLLSGVLGWWGTWGVGLGLRVGLLVG